MAECVSSLLTVVYQRQEAWRRLLYGGASGQQVFQSCNYSEPHSLSLLGMKSTLHNHSSTACNVHYGDGKPEVEGVTCSHTRLTSVAALRTPD